MPPPGLSDLRSPATGCPHRLLSADSHITEPPGTYLGLPLSFHILTTRETGVTSGPRLNSFLSIIRSSQDLMGLFVFSGVFERFPALRIVCVEATLPGRVLRHERGGA